AVFAVVGRPARAAFKARARTTVSDALLASATIASLFGFGEVLVALPGFIDIGKMLSRISDPLLDAVASTTVLAAMTGTASGALNVAADGFATQLLHETSAAGIPAEVLHRIMAVASGGLDTLPHNGAVITYLLVCGLTHRQSYPDMFVLTLLKTAIAFLLVAVYYWTRLV
ncbi:MAG: GntP family permease, partial [Steroidobacteraceae bacterium]